MRSLTASKTILGDVDVVEVSEMDAWQKPQEQIETVGLVSPYHRLQNTLAK